MHFTVGQLVFLGLIQGRKAAKMAFATVRLCLGSNHSSIEHVIFFSTYENQDYEIYKDLMATVFFFNNWDIYSIRDRTASARYGVTRNTKRLKHIGNPFRKNLPLKDVC